MAYFSVSSSPGLVFKLETQYEGNHKIYLDIKLTEYLKEAFILYMFCEIWSSTVYSPVCMSNLKTEKYDAQTLNFISISLHAIKLALNFFSFFNKKI